MSLIIALLPIALFATEPQLPSERRVDYFAWADVLWLGSDREEQEDFSDLAGACFRGYCSTGHAAGAGEYFSLETDLSG